MAGTFQRPEGHGTSSRPPVPDGRGVPEESLLLTTLRAVRARWPTVLLFVMVVPAIALGVALLQEKQYTASASLLFRDPALDQKLFGSSVVQESNDPTRDAQTNVELVSLGAVAERTARVVGRGLTGDQI